MQVDRFDVILSSNDLVCYINQSVKTQGSFFQQLNSKIEFFFFFLMYVLRDKM